MRYTQQLDQKKHSWLCDEGALRIMSAIKAANGEARFVGGIVRDSLLGRAVGDFDLAVTLTPDKVTEALKVEKIRVEPTGIDHGTVTAIVYGKPYELTTLREDVTTDGRHATVAFTDCWEKDALRRDFTINALYADEAGCVYDYANGLEDLAAKKLRFIGAPEKRIQEDVLRILRFYRFCATLQFEAVTKDRMACSALAHLLPKLKVERIWNEVKKWLSSDDPTLTWRQAVADGVSIEILKSAKKTEELTSLVILERKHNITPNALRRLSVLGGAQEAITKWKLSNNESTYLEKVNDLPKRLLLIRSDQDLRRWLYAEGLEPVRDALLLCGVRFKDDPDLWFEVLDKWENPQYPLRGEDLLRIGEVPSPRIGEILKNVENWWIGQDFRPCRAECLAEMQELLAKADSNKK